MAARRTLYRSARLLGDLQAARRGPTSLTKRRVRRVAYRGANRGLGRLLRSLGLG